jgi:uncharacterized damage-inducible protein DinB
MIPTPATPYSAALASRDPLEAIRDTIARVHALANNWSADRFERSYAAGKWSARQILIHLAQCELMFGTRTRLALATPNYAAQNMDQDAWMVHDARLTGPDALEAFVAVGRMNAALFDSLSPADRSVELSHPDYGTLTVDWIIHHTAGHQIHHLRQLEAIAAR